MTKSLICRECKKPITYPGRGRPPTMCDTCRRTRPHRRLSQRRRQSRLTVVPDVVDTPSVADTVDDVHPVPDAIADVLAALDAVQDGTAPVGRIVDGMRDTLAALDIAHPVAPALRAVAERLAAAAHHPLSEADPRTLVTVTKELRETLRQLTALDEGGEDDGWGFGDLRPTMGNATSA